MYFIIYRTFAISLHLKSINCLAMTTLSNQPRKNETYYGVRIYNQNGKYVGSHNGVIVKKKIQWYVKDYLDMFIDELNQVADKLNFKVVIETKTF